MKISLRDLDELRSFARQLSGRLASTPRVVILLEGPMGVGKTTLVREVVEACGSDEASSPSFALHQSYLTRFGAIEHFDLFRLESADDLESTGFWDVFSGGSGIVMIEWSERLTEFHVLEQLPAAWPQWRWRLEFDKVGADPQARRLEFIDSPLK